MRTPEEHGPGRPAWAVAVGLILVLSIHVAIVGLASPWFQGAPSGPDPQTFLGGVTGPPGFEITRSDVLDEDTLDELALSAYSDLVRDGHVTSWAGAGQELIVVIIRTGSSLSARQATGFLALDIAGAEPESITDPVDGERASFDGDGYRRAVTVWSVADVVAIVLALSPSSAPAFTGEAMVEHIDLAARAVGFDAPFVESPASLLGRLASWVVFLIGLLWLGRLLIRVIQGGPRTAVAGVAIDATPQARGLRRAGRGVALVQYGAFVTVFEAFFVALLLAPDGQSGVTPPAARAVVLGAPAVVVVVGAAATLLFRIAEGRGSRTPRSVSGSLMALIPTALGVVILAVGLVVVAALGVANALGDEFFRRVPERVGGAPGVLSVVLLAVGFLCFGATVTLAALTFRWARLLRVRRARRAATELPTGSALLLRSFRDDRGRVAALASGRRGLVDAWSLRASDRFEEVIAWELSDRWPVVAVAEPGGPKRALGAARVSLRDEAWQTAVWQQLHRCPCIVAVLGDTPGFRWEVAAMLRSGSLDRTVFVFPPVPWPQRAQRLGALHSALVDAGAAPGPIPRPENVVALVMDARMGLTTIGVDRWDEAGYRAALRAAFLLLGQRAAQPAP